MQKEILKFRLENVLNVQRNKTISIKYIKIIYVSRLRNNKNEA